MKQKLFALALLLQGCASSTPSLYTLRQEPGPVHTGVSLVVTVRSVGVPRYLERSEIVRGTAPGRMVASDDDWWAEPLRSMLSRVMVDDLGQRLPQTIVLLASGAIPGPPGAEVQVELQRFERDDTGMVILTGTVAIEAAGRPRRIDRLEHPRASRGCHGGGPGGRDEHRFGEGCRPHREPDRAMSPAAISALSALAGSAIGAFSTFATTWLTQHHQAHRERLQQDSRRREQLYGEFVDMAAQLYIDALSHEFEPEKIVPLYALISRMRLFAPNVTMASADAVMAAIVHAYMAPNYRFDLEDEAARRKLDLLRDFTEICRADLAR